jgi:predicted RNA-binding Zn-ribbon protein involved in translation (DUF1610 family)
MGQAIALDFHIGAPTDDQLVKINACLGRSTTAAEWSVVPMLASNNMLSRSWRKWHSNVLMQMANAYAGAVFMLDHEWEESEDNIGFIFDSALVRIPNPGESLYVSVGKTECNQKIMAQEGYLALYCWGAIATSQNTVIDAVAERRLNGCSTGGLLNNPRFVCPNCTEKMGREVEFEEVVDGEYTCPHMINYWR